MEKKQERPRQMQELELEQTQHVYECMQHVKHNQKPQQLKQYECDALVHERS
jgi:hypothetical protein